MASSSSLEGVLKVQFFGESGIDTGGLQKEFLSGNLDSDINFSNLFLPK